tara:strand:- start:34437 stop:36338 length:1902 start_codon:yes stop_codon:yes gene_type:complete
MINLKSLRRRLVNAPRRFKVFLMVINDFYCFYSPFILSFIIEYYSYIYGYETNRIWLLIADLDFLSVISITFISIFLIFSYGGYRSFFRYSEESILNVFSNPRIITLFLHSLAITVFIISNSDNSYISISSSIGISLIIFLNIVVTRSIAFNFIRNSFDKEKIPLVIYGAGQAGRETSAYLGMNELYKVVGFIDDNHKLKNYKIFNKRVFGGLKEIGKLKKTYPNLLIILSIININPTDRKKLISKIQEYEVAVKTIPDGYGSLDSKMALENLNVNDLIDRDEIKLDHKTIQDQIKGRNILITGAGGSIGSEISSQISKLKANKIINLDFSEYNLYKLKNLLKNTEKINQKFILMDLSNKNEIDKLIKNENIEVIYHTAAYKHVPILENRENYRSAVENNFFNTFNLCEIAYKNKIKSFTLISSDKAVNPKNLMGATKRLSELSLQAFHRIKDNETKFSMVRFGNVLNSSGSVVPLFWDQIYSGGPVTVTHEEINRFFMTIEEAASLVIQSSSMSEGGEVFLLDMGNSIKIKELAERMIKLTGNSVSRDGSDDGIKIIYSGLRPGEKLYEELLLSNNPEETEHKKIKKGVEKSFELSEINNLKSSLNKLLKEKNIRKSNELISSFVDGYGKVN